MSITCGELDGLLERRVEDELDPDDTRAIQEHIVLCAFCRGRVAADEALTHALAAMPTLPCPARVVDAIKAATLRPPARARRPLWLPSWPVSGWKQAWVGMAVASACLTMVLMTRMQKNDTVPFENDPGSAETASAVVRWSLVYTAQTLQSSQARVVREAIAGDLPRSVYSAVSRVPILKGVML